MSLLPADYHSKALDSHANSSPLLGFFDPILVLEGRIRIGLKEMLGTLDQILLVSRRPVEGGESRLILMSWPISNSSLLQRP